MISLCVFLSFMCVQYKDDQFAEFDNLVHINASENELPMGNA